MSLIFNSQQIVSDGTTNTYSLSQTTTSANSILVVVNGLVQEPNVDYTVNANGDVIYLVSTPYIHTHIEIKYITTDDVGYRGSQGELGPTGYSGSVGYIGSQGVVGYKGSVGDPGGPTGYTGSVGAGYAGSLGYTGSIGKVGKPTQTSIFVANGSNTYFSLLDATGDPNNILVFTNGLIETPGVDYTVDGPNLIYANPPPLDAIVEVRYFDVVQGETGFRGSVGDVGYRGSIGYFGSVGYQGSVGYFGSVGYKGSKGDPGGPTGYTGSIGYSGSKGDIGYVGSQGIVSMPYKASSYVADGNSNIFDLLDQTADATNILVFTNGLIETPGVDYTVTGTTLTYTVTPPTNAIVEVRYFGAVQGLTGFKGSSGYRGSEGYRGSIGAVGYQGSVGIGYRGSQGIQGYTGSVGPSGSFGGIVFDYIFSSNTVEQDPGAGFLRFNTNVFTTATHFIINKTDHQSSIITNYVNAVDNVGSGIKGHFTLAESANSLNTVLFSIIERSTLSGNYYSIPVNFVSGNTSIFADSEEVVFTLAKTGDIGDTGYTG